MDYGKMHVLSPKKATVAGSLEPGSVFPYYAGYSFAFARSALTSLQLESHAMVLDPWNGAGTTTTAAASLGLSGVGTDLNPVMVLAAKASLLSRDEIPSLLPIARTLTELAREISIETLEEPLAQWLVPSSARYVRAIEAALRHVLLPPNTDTLEAINAVPPLAAFFYACLFRATKSILQSFVPTNPTWVRLPQSHNNRLRPLRSTVEQEFLLATEDLSEALVLSNSSAHDNSATRSIRLGDATSLPLQDGSVDLVLTSPPYCTRIDYAVATSIELSVLGLQKDDLMSLRRSLMGTSTVPKSAAQTESSWGGTANRFLHALSEHPSKASQTYYLKNHLNYFQGLFKATAELGRVVKPGGGCVVVAQDSYYKEVHNDLPQVICEMMAANGLHLARREDFSAARSMAAINSRARRYRAIRDNHESVLCFEKG